MAKTSLVSRIASSRPWPGFASVARMDTLGMTHRTWVEVLSAHRFAVDPIYVPRLLAALSVAIPSSLVAESSAIRVEPRRSLIPVVFIIGHWRSGTTYLHHLLAADRNRFTALDTATAIFPHLRGTRWLRPVLRALGLDREYQRLFDDVVIGPTAPMELEYAVMNMTGVSEYLCWTFPRAKWSLLNDLGDEPSKLSVERASARRRAIADISARLAEAAPGKTVLHKNPPSTACVAELAELFPQARFVFLVREPADVYRSTLKTMRCLNEAGRLQTGGEDDLEAYVIERYVRLHRAYVKQRTRIDPRRLFEVRYRELERDPLGVVARLHEHFGWRHYDERPYRAQLQRSADYRKNRHPPLDDATQARLQRAWGPILEQLGLDLRVTHERTTTSSVLRAKQPKARIPAER